MVKEYFGNVLKLPGSSNRDEILTNLIKGLNHSIYFGSKDNVPHVDGYRLKTTGLIYQDVSENDSPDDAGNWQHYRTRGIDDLRVYKEDMGRAIVASYPYFRGQDIQERAKQKSRLESLKKCWF